MIADQVLPITPAEYRRDAEELRRLEDVLQGDIREAHIALAEAKAELDRARRDAWKTVEGKNRDERHTQVEVLVADEKKRVVDMEGRIAAGRAFSYVLSARSTRLTTDARFAMRQMELDTPGPDRVPHWERTAA